MEAAKSFFTCAESISDYETKMAFLYLAASSVQKANNLEVYSKQKQAAQDSTRKGFRSKTANIIHYDGRITSASVAKQVHGLKEVRNFQ